MEAQELFFVLVFAHCFYTVATAPSNEARVTALPVDGQQVVATVNRSRELSIFCYPGRERAWLQLWANPRLTVEGINKTILPDDLTIYYGKNDEEIRQSASAGFTITLSALLRLKEQHSFTPFNSSCIGLSSTKPYRVIFQIKNPELWYIAYIAAGIIIFFCAPSWSRNVAFHYGTGVSVGVLASFLVVVFILTRLMPQRLKTVSYIVMAVSSSASLFMLQWVRTYLKEVIHDHWQIFLGYVAVTSIISFGLVYRFGPITDTRTMDLVCWVLQVLGLFLIYQGTQIPEASVAIMLLVLTIYVCPRVMPLWIKHLQYRFFPPKRRFLTEEEYLKEAEVETRKALAELREYCRSPKCDTWKTISHLESPSRFAKFVEGDSHVSESEIAEHDSFVPLDNFSDTSNSESDSDANMDRGDFAERSAYRSDSIRVYPGTLNGRSGDSSMWNPS